MLIASGSNLWSNIVGHHVYIHQHDVTWSKQGVLGAIEGVLGDVLEEGSEGQMGPHRCGRDRR